MRKPRAVLPTAVATTSLRSPAYEGLCHPNDLSVHPDSRTAIGYNNFDADTAISD